jgi:hypothetical protein
MTGPGSYGSAYLYFLVPRVFLFREEHSPRVLVDQVDFMPSRRTAVQDLLMFAPVVLPVFIAAVRITV